MFRILLFALVLTSFSCGNSPNSNGEASSTSEATAQPSLGSLPMETIQYLWDQCDYVDYIFYHLPISMSLNEKGSIQYALRHISADAAIINPECKPIGRIFYQVRGENVLEADMFFSEGCTYFKFLRDNKPIYANYMTDDGIKYLNDNIAKGQEFNQGLQQGQ